MTLSRIESARPVETRVLFAPSASRHEVGGSGWVAVGDAASSFDPVSGYGVARALNGALRAADAVHGLLEGDPRGLASYRRWVASAFAAYARTRRTYYESERRWPTGEFWQRRRTAAARAV
jgi:flavin-dependent dehydrogenase